MSPFGSRPGFKLFFLLLAGLVFSNLSALALNDSGAVVFEGGFDAGSWSWESTPEGGTFPVLAGTRTLAEPGQPQVPVKELMLLIPLDRQVAEAWVEPLATRTQQVTEPIAQAKPHITDAGEMVYARRLEAVDGVFPSAWGEFTGTHVWRGYQILTLNVFPARLDASGSHQQIDFLDQYAIRVRYADGLSRRVTVQRERLVPDERRDNEDLLRKLVANPEAVAGYVHADGVLVAEDDGPFKPTRTPSLTGSAVQYLIITNEQMKSEFQRLADFKTSQGMPTLVTTREIIADNYRNGADIQETIRMFIRDAYQKWGTEYVMLGGDTDVLPARYVNNSFYPVNGSTEIPVDLYFACLDGNWNANGNAEFGEAEGPSFAGDDADFAEEVYLGRAPVSSQTAAQVFVDKVIAYETAPAQSGWTDRILYAAEVLFPSEYEEGGSIHLDGAQFADQMVNDLVEPCTDMQYARMYETDALFPRDAVLTKEALIDSLNTGHYGIFNQIGHGFYFNMSVGNGNFMTTDADNLTNGDHLFMLFALNCASAAFDYSCLMERFIQNPNGGSVISIGAARAAFPGNTNNYQQGFFSALYCSAENRAGKLVAISRWPYLGNTVSNYVDRWTFENYTLLGDPTLPIWTGVPEAVSASATSLDLGPNQVTITVNDEFDQPVQDARVCLSRSGEDYAYGLTNSSGQVNLDYLVNAPGSVQLTVTGENLAWHQSQLPVTSGETYLALDSLILVDDGQLGSTGNGNLMAEAGETVGLLPTLEETAGSGTTGLSGILSTTAPGVTILNNSVSFSDVAGGGLSTVSEPFLVSFAEDLVDGTPVTFRLDLSDGSAQDYELEWVTLVKAPEVEVVLMDWEDETYGNGDGMLGDGERVVVTVKLKNFGAGRVDDVDLRLRSYNANVVLYDTVGTVSDLDLMDTAEVVGTFSLSLTNAGRKTESFLHLTDNYGRTQDHDFYLQRPATPLNIVTDTSLGADVIALSWDPVEDEDTFGYDVFRSENPGGPYARVNSDVVAGTSYYRDEGLGLLTRYYYQVRSLDVSRVPSEVSEIVTQATAPAEGTGFPVEFETETSGHLAVGDVDGDGYPEVVLGADELYVWHHDGTELLDGDSDSQTLGPVTGNHVAVSPAGIVLAQLDGQPGLEMIYCDRGNPELVYILDKNGEVLPGWPQTTDSGTGTQWVWATPAVGDIDGDNEPEIVLNALNGRTWAWHKDGTEVRDGDNDPATNGLFLARPGAEWEWGLSSPALYDLDGDGAKDIIFGTGVDDLGGSRLVALKSDGTNVPGFPYYTTSRVNNSPAVGDLNNDGQVEIVFYDWAKNLYVVQQDGSAYPGFPVNFGFGSMTGGCPSVGLGDLDQDGQLEIIFAGNNTGDLSKLVCVDTDVAGGTSGQALNGWPVDLPGSSEGSPVVGDIDGDGIPDILYGIGGGSEDAPNNLYAFKANGQPIDGFPITLSGPLMPSPVICDLDRDQDVDIVLGAWDRLVHVWDMPFAYDQRNCPWPTFHGNMQRDGVYIPGYLVPVEDGNDLPAAAFRVDAPYPNPFNPSTSVRLHVPTVNGASSLELVVYDLQGRRVRVLHNGPIAGGWHTMVWDGRDNSGRAQSSGLYFMRARSGSHASIHKMTLVK